MLEQALEMPLVGGTVLVTDKNVEQVNFIFVRVIQMIDELIESDDFKDVWNLGWTPLAFC